MLSKLKIKQFKTDILVTIIELLHFLNGPTLIIEKLRFYKDLLAYNCHLDPNCRNISLLMNFTDFNPIPKIESNYSIYYNLSIFGPNYSYFWRMTVENFLLNIKFNPKIAKKSIK